MKRILLKLSGEALAGEKKTGFEEKIVLKVARQVREVTEEGIQVGVVIGGGNFWRGRSSENMDLSLIHI
jgi:uridylate kinase